MKLIFTLILTAAAWICIYSQANLYTLDSVKSPGFDKRQYSYDQLNRHVQTQSYEFSPGNGGQNLLDQMSFLYDANDNIIEQEFFMVQNGVLFPNTKALLNYNAQGYLANFVSLWYDLPNNTYWNSNKTDYIRDANGTVLNEYSFFHTSGNWVLSGKVDYTYDVNGNATQQVNMNTYDNGVTFDSVAKQVYVYSGNNAIETTGYVYNTGGWNPTNKIAYTYDANGNPTQTLHYNYVNQMWEEFFKEEMTYNANNDIILYISYLKQGNNWNPEYKMENTFDVPLLASLVIPQDFKYNAKIDASQVFQPIGGTGAWSLIKTDNYYYSQENGTNSLIENKENNMIVFPNPANDMIFINPELGNQEWTITNLSGLTVWKGLVENGALNIADFSSGVYMLYSTNNPELIQRFIVQK